MCVSEASVAKESLAEGCGRCKEMAEERSDLAVSNASFIAGVQDRVPILEVASMGGLRVLEVPGRKWQ
jgi:hypothetical protein